MGRHAYNDQAANRCQSMGPNNIRGGRALTIDRDAACMLDPRASSDECRSDDRFTPRIAYLAGAADDLLVLD